MVQFLSFQFIFDVNQLPPCMLNPNFRVFGVHIWLQNHNKTTMRCNPPSTPAPQPRTTVTYKEPHSGSGAGPNEDKLGFEQSDKDQIVKNRRSDNIQPPLPNKKSGGNSAAPTSLNKCLLLFVFVLRTILSQFSVQNVQQMIISCIKLMKNIFFSSLKQYFIHKKETAQHKDQVTLTLLMFCFMIQFQLNL